MSFSLRIESLDNRRCGIILNDRFWCEATFPLQEEWLLQAIFSALKSQGYNPSGFLTRQSVNISRIEELRKRTEKKQPLKTSTEVIKLEDLGL